MATAKAKPKTGKTTKGATAKTGKSATGKTAAKGSLKAVPKTAKKATSKAAPKPAPKVAVKTKKAAPKPAPKTAAKKPKAAPKPPAKPAHKAATKPAAKPAPNPTPVATPAVKPIAKPSVAQAPVAAPMTQPIARPVVKTASKPAPIVTVTHSTVKVAGLLSEAEIVKQAKTEYMSRQQLAFFKHRLLALQNELRENAGATTEHLREIAVAPDPADRATLEEEHALELRTRDRERKLLKKVEAALVRIEDGSYGYCEETGDPIGIQRLIARPTATLTIEAQERRELKQKMYGE